MLLLGRYTLHWRQSIRTNINVNDAAYGRRSISYARSDGPALTAGAFLHARQHHHAGLVSLTIFAVEMPCSSQRNRDRSDCNSMVILRHPSQSRWMSSSRRTTRDPDMRQCNSVEELVQMAHEHLDVLTPRGKSAFWTILSKLLQNRGGRPSHLHRYRWGRRRYLYLDSRTLSFFLFSAHTSNAFAGTGSPEVEDVASASILGCC